MSMKRNQRIPDRISAGSSGIYEEGTGITLALPIVRGNVKNTLAVMEELKRRYNAFEALLAAAKLTDEWYDLVKQNYPEMMRSFEATRAALARVPK